MGLCTQSMELLATSLALSARSPAFPELAHLPSLALKRFIKAATVERFRSQARLLLDAISASARVVGMKRDAVEFAPKDTEDVAAFMRCGAVLLERLQAPCLLACSLTSLLSCIFLQSCLYTCRHIPGPCII